MTSGEGTRTRRDYLQILAGTGLAAGLAGCSGDTSSEPDDRPTETPAKTPTTTPTQTQTPDSTPTPEPDQAPNLATATVTPQANGETLAYHVVAEDDQGLEYVAVSYGEREEEWTEDVGRRVAETGQLSELGQPLEDGQVAFVARDTAGQETREERYPDQQAPSLSALQLEPTETAGEIRVTVEAEDNFGLEGFALRLGDQTIHQHDVSGQSEASAETTLDISNRATPGEQHTLTARLEDWNGNTTQSDSDTYVRKYDVMEETRLDVGAIHYPWMGKHFDSTVTDDEGEPAVGHYEDWKNSPMNEVANRQIDEIQGYGINKLMIDFGEWETDYERFNHFQEAELFDEIDFEAYYVVSQALRRDRDLEADFEFMRENMLNRDNYNTVNGRPVVQLYVPGVLTTDFVDKFIQIRSDLIDEHGSLANFTKYMRGGLTVNDTEPFMIATTNLQGVNGFKDEYSEFWNGFDGFTNWVGGLNANETTSNEESLEFMEDSYRGINEYKDEDQVFWPMVIPGFDDRHNEAWGQDRRIPRSTEYFQEMLALAEEYGDGRINIYSWNEWTEGSQIEPGSFRDEEYGTEYLEVVEQFQQEGG